MPKPVEKNGKYYCPYCHVELSSSAVRYYKVVKGAYKGATEYKETTWECKECGYSYWIKEEI